MDVREEDVNLPETVRLKPRPGGRGLPVPPILPLVAVVSILLGLSLGYRISPGPAPTSFATPTFREIATAAATATAPAIATAPALVAVAEPTGKLNPPTGGLTLQQLLQILAGPSMGIAAADVIAARVDRYDLVTATATRTQQWVWVVTMRDDVMSETNGHECFTIVGPVATLQPGCVVVETTETLILDYRTGEFLEAQSRPRA
jgi:hypothetical protein